MIRLLTANLWWKLFALVAGFAFWLNVASEPELATIVSVPVEYRNSPKDLEISSKIVDSLDMEARGPAGQIRALRDSRVAAIIDFATVTAAGERTFTLTPSELKLPRGITLVRTIPAQLRFTFERVVTREIGVQLKFSGEMPKGYVVTNVDIDPPMLTIAGPESHVMSSKRLITDPFDRTNVTGDAVQKLSVYAEESEVRITGVPQVTVKIRVQRKS